MTSMERMVYGAFHALSNAHTHTHTYTLPHSNSAVENILISSDCSPQILATA